MWKEKRKKYSKNNDAKSERLKSQFEKDLTGQNWENMCLEKKNKSNGLYYTEQRRMSPW